MPLASTLQDLEEVGQFLYWGWVCLFFGGFLFGGYEVVDLAEVSSAFVSSELENAISIDSISGIA